MNNSYVLGPHDGNAVLARDMKVRWGRMVTAYIENGIAVSRFMPFLTYLTTFAANHNEALKTMGEEEFKRGSALTR